MDDNRFDNLVRTFAIQGGSRRQVLRRLGAGALAMALGRVGLEEAAAKCAKAGKKCGKGTKCCSGAACKGGKCTCKAGLTQCGAKCANLQADEANCGACGKACPNGQTCCDGVCRDLTSDEANCGACGEACGPEEECRGGGTCVCAPPHVECGDACCPLGQVCFNGRCTTGQGVCAAGSDSCAQGLVSCNGGGCICLQRFEGGGSRCVLPENNPGCATCNSDFDCDRDEGPGRVCVRGGAKCPDCNDQAFGFCAPLCPIQVGA